jgi:3-deoxy-D-glycero-D-galacto-nononate 9-phosphate synthase
MTYLIAEIGQNHNGSIDIAKLIIEGLAWPVEDQLFNNEFKKFDAVKLTKRDLAYELTKEQMDRPYENLNSFGKTYGEHREVLELSDEEHYEVYKYAKLKGFDFIETLCAPSCLSMLKYFTPDKLKVASRDLTNIPLLNALAETKIPLILSTGMGGVDEIESALEVISRHHDDVSILHCVSEYPTNPLNWNLNSIVSLREQYPNKVIGYSDHSIGISAPLAAVALGARIIEKHVTIDRRMKGTDQKGSLGIDGTQRLVRDIRQFEEGLGKKETFISESVKSAKLKLERSLSTKTFLKKGEILAEDNLIMLSPGDGIPYSRLTEIIGRKLKRDYQQHEQIHESDCE